MAGGSSSSVRKGDRMARRLAAGGQAGETTAAALDSPLVIWLTRVDERAVHICG